MKVYAIREFWPYEIYDLVEFFVLRANADARARELNEKKPEYYGEYSVEEIEVK